MIDFRYHLVSIIAVFLALAVGVVVGAAALRPAATNALYRLSKHEKKTIETLQQDNGTLKKQISADQAFAQSASARLLNGLLTGQQVVLVTAPGADSQTITGITGAVRQAGARVSGQVSLQPQFFDTSGGAERQLAALAQQLAPPGISAGGQPGGPQLTGQQAAARVISAALVSKNGAGLTGAQVSGILAGFEAQGYLHVTSSPAAAAPQSATLAVVILPATPPASDSTAANLGLIAVAQQLQAAGRGTVLAGALAGSGAGSAIDAIASGSVSAALTTVDDADTEVGAITVAQALSELLAGHGHAAYGVGPGAFPSPAPGPSVSASGLAGPITPAAGRAAGG